ncbi:TenA family protein [Lichenicoccus sp.]|uniref:TenA family protein n=1 Tax=Lichenicoccus sp. TaxID=2781899 RepID=UPI003D0D7BB6
MVGISQTILAANRDVWDDMQSHRFIEDIAADRLPLDVFERYLVFEYGFVETAMLIFGHAMLKASSFRQRRWLIGVLHALAEEQMGTFRQAFNALGIAPPTSADPPVPEAVRAFSRGMMDVAQTGDYPDLLAIMLAAEWMYAAWCSRIDLATIDSPELRRWVALHASSGFLAQAAWLRAEIDTVAAKADVAGRDRLSSLFRRALLLEIDFHHAAYDTSWSVPRRTLEDTLL